MQDADSLAHVDHLQDGLQTPLWLSYIRSRGDDYYISLVGEVFRRLREGYPDSDAWATLGNSFAQIASPSNRAERDRLGIDHAEAALLGATAFYVGGYPASAYLVLKELDPANLGETSKTCYELLVRRSPMVTHTARTIVSALRGGNQELITKEIRIATDGLDAALLKGPNDWVAARLLERILARFSERNIREVLPEGYAPFWSLLVRSFLGQRPPVWEFFPSQIEAIKQGLLQSQQTFSLQMPTGAGKTALCETLLYSHLKTDATRVAVVLVPYRSLASELRRGLVKRLNNKLGISARCAYGGTVPTGDEVRELDATRVVVATPEALLGILGADPAFLRRITLVICDEGHLLDGDGRGVSLELLLARLNARNPNPPRFVFISAIVPNIEEINAWLGGERSTVVRSLYRPSIAEFACLRPQGTGGKARVGLELHPHKQREQRYLIENFLTKENFKYRNPRTGNLNTAPFTTVKVQALAAARKMLRLGTVAIFAANKSGNRGVIGLAEALVEQLMLRLPLPRPLDFADPEHIAQTYGYLEKEYGPDWIGSRLIEAGAVLHHGDIPQETREVFERLLSSSAIRLAICTNTLAEGVNLPIRTLVLYSVMRSNGDRSEAIRSRDIKNLVGRSGRAGSSVKGMVICANSDEWEHIERVANQLPGEDVEGALSRLLLLLRQEIAHQNTVVTNQNLEKNPLFHTLIDGIDGALLDLAAEEIGGEALVELALGVAERTFALQRADMNSRETLRLVFSLRAKRIAEIRESGRLAWIRDTGAKPRLLDAVVNDLQPHILDFNEGRVSIRDLVRPFVEWAWAFGELEQPIARALRDRLPASLVEALTNYTTRWISGEPFRDIAATLGWTVDQTLAIHTSTVSYTLQTAVEQGVALLEKSLLEGGVNVG